VKVEIRNKMLAIKQQIFMVKTSQFTTFCTVFNILNLVIERFKCYSACVLWL